MLEFNGYLNVISRVWLLLLEQNIQAIVSSHHKIHKIRVCYTRSGNIQMRLFKRRIDFVYVLHCLPMIPYLSKALTANLSSRKSMQLTNSSTYWLHDGSVLIFVICFPKLVNSKALRWNFQYFISNIVDSGVCKFCLFTISTKKVMKKTKVLVLFSDHHTQ